MTGEHGSHFSARLRRYLRSVGSAWPRRVVLLCRGILFLGRKYRCPCCGWRVRAFVAERSVMRRSANGYCPRCNAKARHRRDWLYLREETDVLAGPKRLLEIAPWWSLSRCFRKAPNIEFFGIDLKKTGPHVTTIGDIVKLPFANASFDVVVCIHVLEPTREDPSITDPCIRQRLFGESSHVRYYGMDMIDRLKGAGFEVTLDLAEDLPADRRNEFALRNDENVFYCVKSTDPWNPADPAGHTVDGNLHCAA